MISQSRVEYASAGSRLATLSVVPMMMVSGLEAAVGAVVAASVGSLSGGSFGRRLSCCTGRRGGGSGSTGSQKHAANNNH